MSYFLWVEIEGFYVEHYDIREQPLIVEREKVVLDANALARQRGVRLGMEVRQAKAVVSECVVQNWEPELYQPRRNAWLDVCTNFTGVIEPIDQHIAALDLSGHPNPLDVTEQIVRDLVSKTKLNVHYGAAPSVWIAKLAADREDLGRAIASPTQFLSKLPVADLLPASEESRNRLTFLGYRTIGEIANLPLSTLQGQFGEEALIILAAAQGRHFQPVHALYPLDSLHECLIFDGAVEVWEAVDEGLRSLADRIGRRLTEKNMQGSKLTIKIDMEERTLTKERRFTKPIHNPLTALIALRLLIQEAPKNVSTPHNVLRHDECNEFHREHGADALFHTNSRLEAITPKKHPLSQVLPGQEPSYNPLQFGSPYSPLDDVSPGSNPPDLQSAGALNAPVLGIHISLTDLEKTRYRQQELEGFSLRSKRPEVASAISYVRTVFGDNSVKLGSQIELPRRVRVLKEWQNATGWR